MCQRGALRLVALLLTVSPLTTPADGSSSTERSTTTQKSDAEDYDPKSAYCFEFTWLGPSYDNTIEFDKTCEDFLAENYIEANGLCRQPIVITNDSTLPDLHYLYEHETYKYRVLRRRRKGEVCVKYAYTFNDEVMNITYMRAKVFARSEGAVTSGCFAQESDGSGSELCVCEPRAGPYFPCNAAPAGVAGVGASVAAIAALACALARRPI